MFTLREAGGIVLPPERALGAVTVAVRIVLSLMRTVGERLSGGNSEASCPDALEGNEEEGSNV